MPDKKVEDRTMRKEQPYIYCCGFNLRATEIKFRKNSSQVCFLNTFQIRKVTPTYFPSHGEIHQTISRDWQTLIGLSMQYADSVWCKTSKFQKKS